MRSERCCSAAECGLRLQRDATMSARYQRNRGGRTQMKRAPTQRVCAHCTRQMCQHARKNVICTAAYLACEPSHRPLASFVLPQPHLGLAWLPSQKPCSKPHEGQQCVCGSVMRQEQSTRLGGGGQATTAHLLGVRAVAVAVRVGRLAAAALAGARDDRCAAACRQRRQTGEASARRCARGYRAVPCSVRARPGR
jgi:hypothetical protein